MAKHNQDRQNSEANQLPAQKTAVRTPARRKRAGTNSIWLALIRAIENSSFRLGRFIHANGFGTILLTIVLLVGGSSWLLRLL